MSGNVVAFFRPTRPTRYALGDVHGELHFIRGAGAGTIVRRILLTLCLFFAHVSAMLIICGCLNLCAPDAPTRHGHGYRFRNAVSLLPSIRYLSTLMNSLTLARCYCFELLYYLHIHTLPLHSSGSYLRHATSVVERLDCSRLSFPLSFLSSSIHIFMIFYRLIYPPLLWNRYMETLKNVIYPAVYNMLFSFSFSHFSHRASKLLFRKKRRVTASESTGGVRACMHAYKRIYYHTTRRASFIYQYHHRPNHRNHDASSSSSRLMYSRSFQAYGPVNQLKIMMIIIMSYYLQEETHQPGPRDDADDFCISIMKIIMMDAVADTVIELARASYTCTLPSGGHAAASAATRFPPCMERAVAADDARMSTAVPTFKI
jgi:hypothetical protein